MDDRLLEQGRQFSEKRRKRRTWKNIVSVLACVVVFCTTYALILPAITMEKDTYCGHEEHKHDDECYQAKLVCTLSGETSVSHEHNDDCYVKEQELVCGKEESTGHTHSDACKKVEKSLTCGQEESEGHAHSDSCYAEDGTLSCGKEESAGHTHTDACYTENTSIICGQEESEGHTHSDACYEIKKVLKCEKDTSKSEAHVHTEACYEKKLVCEKEEHTHEKICYSDKTADVETATDWEKTLPDELTGNWAEDVLAVAESQLKYAESTKNFIVTEDDEVKGYSRYGAWYGDPYGHWCAMFASFCLGYAEVDKELMPQDANCQNWIETLSKEEYELYHEAKDYEPVPGDLIFFNFDEDKDSDHVGFVVEVIEETENQKAQVKTIEGNSIDNNVRYLTYDLDNESIMGYGQLPENPDEKMEEEVVPVVEEEAKEELEVEETEEETTLKMTAFGIARSTGLTGNWSTDVANVAIGEKTYVGNADGTSKYGEWYGDPDGDASVLYPLWCLSQANVDTDVIPVLSKGDAISVFDWSEKLKNSEYDLVEDRSGYFAKPGDLVIVNTNEWQNVVDYIGIVVNTSGQYEYDKCMTIARATVDSDGVVKIVEEQFRQYAYNGRIAGIITLVETKTSSQNGVLTAQTTNNKGVIPSNAELVVNLSEDNAVWNELVKTDLISNGYSINSEYYLDVCFEKDGVQVEPTQDVKIDIKFTSPLNANIYKDELSGEHEWVYGVLSEGESLTITTVANELEVSKDANLSITDAIVNYEQANIFAMISSQKRYTRKTETKDNITVTAKYNSSSLPEGAELIVEVIPEENVKEAWVDGIKENLETIPGYQITKNHFIDIHFEYENMRIEPKDSAVELTISFEEPLDANASTYEKSEKVEWYFRNIHTEDGETVVKESSSNVELDIDEQTEGLSGLETCYEKSEVYALSAMQESYTTIQMETPYGIATAIGKSTVLSENMKLVLKMLNEDGNVELWTGKLKENYQTPGYLLANNLFFTVEIRDENNEKITLDENENIDIILEFEPNVEITLDEGQELESVEWKLNTVLSSGQDITIGSLSENNEVVINTAENFALDKVTFGYEDHEVLVLSAVALDSNYTQRIEVTNYEELQNAIIEAGVFKTEIVIAEDFSASDTLTIDNNKDIVIDLNGHVISTQDTLFEVKGGTLSITDKGRSNSNSETIKYNVTESQIVNTNTGESQETVVEYTATLSGRIKGGNLPIIVIENDENSEFNFESGALVDSTNRAIVQKGGTLNLKGGYICRNTATSLTCTSDVSCWDQRISGGAIYVTGNSTVNLSGTVLVANSAPERGGAIAIESSDKAIVNMTGGVISGNICTSNEASAKDAVNDTHMGGGGISAGGNVTLNLNGGYITNNRANPVGYYDGGGGVFVKNGCSLIVDGVYVTGNYSASSGGGIYTAADMLMTSGYINSNYADLAEGGGIAVNEPALAFVYGGYINNNKTNTEEHWGGGGLFCANRSTLIIENALVTENHADGYGGGIAGCSTGRVYLFVKKGAAIYSNTAFGTSLSGKDSTKNDDHTSVNRELLKYGFEDYFCSLNSVVENYMLGGYPANWKGSIDGIPVEAAEGDTLVSTYVMLLQSHPSAEAKAVAQREAKIYINGNYSSTHGGGVLANGYLVVGEEGELPVYSRIRLQASKEMVGTDVLKADQFEFVIKNADTGLILATARNDENGIIRFDEMIPFMEEGTFTYLVYENPEVGSENGILMDSSVYRITVTVDKIPLSDVASLYKRYQYKISKVVVDKKEMDTWENVFEKNYPEYAEELPLDLSLTTQGASFVNYQVDKTSISALKKWVGIEPEEGTTVEVQLYRNNSAQGGSVFLSAENNWYYNWGELPLYEVDSDGNKIVEYTYTVKEVSNTSEYDVTYDVHNSASRDDVWVLHEGPIKAEERYIIVSGDGKYVLNLTSNTYNWVIINEDDKQTVTPKSEPIELNGIEYSEYYYDSELSENCRYIGSDENGKLVLKYWGSGWNMLAAKQEGGTFRLHSGYDPTSNIFVGDVQIGYNTNSTEEYKVVFDGEKFTVAKKDDEHQNEAKLYKCVTGKSKTESLFTITNTKRTEDKLCKLDITKVSAKDNNIRLAGAHFSIYLADENGELVLKNGNPVALSFIKATSGTYHYCSSNEEGAVTDIVTDTETDFWGKLILDKLPTGKYILREIAAPNGYEVIEDRVVDLGEDAQSTIEITIEDERIEEDVYELPETGGPGTNVYTAGGILLLMISVLLYIKRKNQMKGGQLSN